MVQTITAIILAGGNGTRLEGLVPKQYLELGAKSVIDYSIDIFSNHPEIHKIT